MVHRVDCRLFLIDLFVITRLIADEIYPHSGFVFNYILMDEIYLKFELIDFSVISNWQSVDLKLSINPKLGGLFKSPFWGGRGGGGAPCLKPVRIMPETLNLVQKYRCICSFWKYTFLIPRASKFCWCQHLFGKDQHFFGKNGALLKAIV